MSRRQALEIGLSPSMIDWRRDRGTWRPLLAGTYLVNAEAQPEDWSALPFQTRLAAARLSHGPTAVAVLRTAATIHGLQGLPRDDGLIHLRLQPGGERHQQAGVRLHTWLIDSADCASVSGVPTTGVVRTLADLLLGTSRFDAVSLLDAALNAGALGIDQLDMVEAALVGRRGAVEARRHVAASNGLAQSPLETRIRLIAKDAGLPPHHLQLPVRDRNGVLLGYADMAWDLPNGRLLVAEADGKEPHSRPEALYRDRRRANDFVGVGTVDMVRFTWEDVERPGYVVSVLRRHLAPSRS